MPESRSDPAMLIRKLFGDVAPALVEYSDKVVVNDLWQREELTPRERSLITVAALVAGGHTEQLEFHLRFGQQNGLTKEELVEVITHMAFYSGWPHAMSAIAVAKRVFRDE